MRKCWHRYDINTGKISVTFYRLLCSNKSNTLSHSYFMIPLKISANFPSVNVGLYIITLQCSNSVANII
jgi:hypothetical protein